MDPTAIAAWGAVIIAIIGAVFSGLASLRNGKKIDTVQTTVNGHTERAISRNEQLTAALTDANVAVPPSPPTELPPV